MKFSETNLRLLEPECRLRESRANYFESSDIRSQPKRFWSIFKLTNKSSNFPDVMSLWRLLDWFNAYLTNRKQRVTVSGETSTEVLVSSGVPQGSLLGPLLFLLFVNNLPQYRCSSSNVACFADDTKICKLIDSVDDSKALQSDLDSLMDWSTSTFLQFNQQKCKSQRITRKRNPIEHQDLMNGSVLDATTAEKDLGVWISSDLTWTNQVYHQSNKANKLLGFIRRSSKYIRKSSTRRTMYLALVRPHLGYATQVWSPQSIELMKSIIERVQRRATKYILMLPFQTEWSYQDRLKQCNLLPISYWHEMMDLAFLYKATNGLIDIDRSILPTIRRSARVTRSCHASNANTYTTKRCRTLTYQRSFFVRTRRIWILYLPTLETILFHSLCLKTNVLNIIQMLSWTFTTRTILKHGNLFVLNVICPDPLLKI